MSAVPLRDDADSPFFSPKGTIETFRPSSVWVMLPQVL
jgi:hypothetical protein